MGKGQKAFLDTAFSPRSVIGKAAAYALLFTDDHVNVTGAAIMTLPIISTMAAAKLGVKIFKITNSHTAANTVNPGSGNTINGFTTYSVPIGQTIIIQANQGDTNWEVVSPNMDQGITGRVRQTIVAVTNGTTAVAVFGGVAPIAFTVESFVVIANDTTASNIVLKNGTNTVASVAKSTTTTVPTGEEALANTAVSKAAVFTVESSGTGNAACLIGIVIN